MKVHLDFETRSTVEIWDSGAWIYSTHQSTTPLCAAFAVDDEPVQLVTFEEFQDQLKNGGTLRSLGLSRLKALANRTDVLFVAHNAFFEQCIWANVMQKKLGMPPIPIERWRCTAAKAGALSLPLSLEKSALALGITEQKNMTGKQVMIKLAKPRKPKKDEVPGGEYWYSDPEDFATLYQYCVQDVEVERQLDKFLPDLSPKEQELWFIDQRINFRGVRADMEFVRQAHKILVRHTARLNGELNRFTNGAVGKGTEVAGMLAYLKTKGVELPDLTKASVHDAIKSGKLDEHCVAVLRYRQELGKSSNAKYQRLLDASDEEGVVRDCFQYHAASTGRWGGKLVQLQNLPANREGVDIKDAIENVKNLDYDTLCFIYGRNLSSAVSASLRGVFIPREGNELLVADYSAIEARVVMWLAGEETGLKEFRDADAGRGVEIYVRMAQKIYGDMSLTKENKAQRTLGKTTILGAGYGMGAPKFYQTCVSYGMQITEEQAAACIDIYRRAYASVPRFWRAMERSAIQAFNAPGTTVPCGKVAWYYHKPKDYLFCRLPSGRFLAYKEPRIVQGRFGSPVLSYMTTDVNTQWVRKETYGGHLVENATQAIARDIMSDAMVRLERQGYPIVMHTHDEIVADVAKDTKRIEDMVDVMCTLPEWAEGCPIKAEGFKTERYTK